MAALTRFTTILFILLLAATPADSGEIEETCRRIGEKLGSVSFEGCLERHLQPSGHYSVENTPLLIKEYPPLPFLRPLARILVLGGIHGDEYSSISVVFRWLEILDRQHNGLYHWKVVPLLNPDGLLRQKSQRSNSRKVDLNRNFSPIGDPGITLRYWQEHTRRDPRRYPGPAPLSEPETVFVTRLLDEFQPDLIISVHAPYGILDFDGPVNAPQKLGQLHLHLLGTFPGSLGNYAGVQMGVPVVTIELPSAGRLPNAGEIGAIWHDLGVWLTEHLPDRGNLLYYSRLRP